MADTSLPFTWYDKGIKHLTEYNILSVDVKVALLSSSYTPNAATHEYYDVHITNELTTANGYTAGGQSLTTKTLTEISAGNWSFDSDNPVWTASGGTITARLMILYNNTPVSNKPLIGYGYLNYNGGSPADVATLSGYPLTIILPANGWFVYSKVNA